MVWLRGGERGTCYFRFRDHRRPVQGAEYQIVQTHKLCERWGTAGRRNEGKGWKYCMSPKQSLVGHETESRCYSRRSRCRWRLSNRITWWRMKERGYHLLIPFLVSLVQSSREIRQTSFPGLSCLHPPYR